jgi:hypothetical protein
MISDDEGLGLGLLPGGWPEDYPRRAALFDVEPEGVCGASSESLYSIFRRTCAAYKMRPFTLAAAAAAPIFGMSRRECSSLYGQEKWLQAMNGSGGCAERWSSALSRLTLREDLYLHTLLPIRYLIPQRGLLGRQERFCSECFRDDERKKRPKYHRLLWAITSVEACPVHGTRLQEELGVDKSGRNHSYWLPGVSRIDGRSLADVPSTPARPESIRNSVLVSNLLDDIQYDPNVFAEFSYDTPSFLWHVTDSMFDGVPCYFANHLGVTKSALHGWMSGKVHPSLPNLLLIAHCVDCGLTDILLSNKVGLQKIKPFNRPAKAPRRVREQVSDEAIHSALANSLDNNDNLCASEIARRLGVGVKRMRRVAPEQWNALVQRHLNARKERCIDEREHRFSVFYRSFQELQSKGQYPSRRLVAKDVLARTGVAPRFSDRFLNRAHALSGTEIQRPHAVGPVKDR